MDILTQGLLGSALAQTGARPAETRLATAVGFVAGLLADADVLIRSSSDPLLQLEYHRHFTHSLFFVPIGALIAALLLWPVLRHRLPFGRLYLFALLGYSLSGFLDTATTYGTYLLWPLVDERLAFNIIAVVDPVFTLILLVGVVVAFRRRLRRAAAVSVVLAGAYLLVGFVQHERALSAARDLAAARGQTPERLLVKPTLGNLILWRAIYVADGIFHVDGIRVGLGAPRVFEGGSAAAVEPAQDITSLPRDSVLYRDILQFTDFSDGYLIRHPLHPQVLGDVRYALLPIRIEPLWGIDIGGRQPDEHARYEVYRDSSPELWEAFAAMLLGRSPGP